MLLLELLHLEELLLKSQLLGSHLLLLQEIRETRNEMATSRGRSRGRTSQNTSSSSDTDDAGWGLVEGLVSGLL